jgi:hypothetical protein
MRNNQNVSLFTELTSSEQINLSGGVSYNLDSVQGIIARGGDGGNGFAGKNGQPGESVFLTVPEGGTATAIGGAGGSGGTNGGSGGAGGDATIITGY